MRCRWQQGHGFSSLPQPIKRHEALKNDVSTLVVILATTPNWLWSARIHNAIAEAMSNVRCRWQQSRGYSSLPQPIKRHEALKNDVFILVVILATTPNWLWSARIHKAIAVAMSNALPRATRSWILQSASAYKAA